jgi:preprotein translocase subunit SecY
MKFLEALANVFRIPDLRKRVIFTLAMLAVYRLGGHLPIPGVDAQKFQDFIQANQGTVFGFFDLFSGGTFRRLTIFALGIMPYITSSIILQLLTVVVPTLEKLQKEGELGRRKITQWTRYLTIILAIVQSFGISSLLQGSQQGFVTTPGIGFILMTILTRITVVGGLYLSILSLLPQIMIQGIKLQRLPVIGNWIDAHFPRFLLDGLGVTFFFGGTSLLIVVGVAMDTVNQIEAQLIMRHYEGFTPRAGRIRGRRSSV